MQPRDLHRSRAAFQELQLARSKGTSCWKAAVGLLLVAAVIWAHAATGTRDSTHDGHRESEVMGRVKSWAQAEVEGAQPQTTPAPDVTPKLPASRPVSASRCGDGRCEPPETSTSCGADCPGVTTPPQCGEEPHSDVGGSAVVWGASHKKDSAAQCCDACAAHAADPKNARKPCNSWVFCYTYPQCWSLDTGNWHGFGECWLKHQTDPKNPLYGQRGAFTDEFRRKHANAHKTGRNPDGTRRNLSVPTHVPWTAGVMYAGRPPVDLSVKWFTGPEGMTSSTGASTVMWRAWESREQNLARGVDPATMPK